MKKTALVLGMFVFSIISCDKQYSTAHKKNYLTVSYTDKDFPSTKSQSEISLVQLHKAGMSQMKFGELQEALGKIDIANYVIENDTKIILIETLNHNVNVKGFNKMVDNFNLLYASDNEVLMKSYQSFADHKCKKIYGCVGTVNDGEYDWKVIRFLPNPEKCSFEPTITMSNTLLNK